MSELTPEEMRADIEGAPYPCEGEPIYDRFEADDLDKGYETCIRSLARALLIVAADRPELLDVSAEREGDQTGYDAADNRKLWEAAKERFPGLDDWLGGCTGFQYGLAHQSVRYALGADAVGNPAVMTIRTGDDG